MSNKQEQTLHVRVSKATNIVWEGEAVSVSSENASGTFDILPLHANFITLIEESPIVIIDSQKEQREYRFKQSVILVTNNSVRIYADISEK